MPKTNEGQAASNQKPNWVEVSTLVVLTLTLIAGGILACLAYQQNQVTMRSLEINSRPYISLTLDPRSIVTKPGGKIRIVLMLNNLGSTPADVRTKGIIIHSATKLPAPSVAAVAEDRNVVFPKEPRESGLFIYSPDPITEGQFRDMMAGTGWLYVRILSTYGVYHTEICIQYKLHPSTTGNAITSDFTEIVQCADPKSNGAN